MMKIALHLFYVILLVSCSNDKEVGKPCADEELRKKTIDAFAFYQLTHYMDVEYMDEDNPSFNNRYVKNMRSILKMNREFLNRYFWSKSEEIEIIDYLGAIEELRNNFGDSSFVDLKTHDELNRNLTEEEKDPCFKYKLILLYLLHSNDALASNAENISLH